MSINQSVAVNSSWKDIFPQENRYFETDNGILYCANNIEVLKQIADNVIDTVVTDPPYGFKFMGNKWDYDVPSVETWQEVLRVIKPGATLLSFAGSRTQHRMAINIEDAGFILKDMLMWLYSTGFPKAIDISKQIDKKLGADRKVIGYKERFGREGRKANCGFKKEYIGTSGTQSLSALETITIPATPEAKFWDGFKSHSLKPAYEPIIMAIKQNDGSYANNALKWGVSGLNIQAGRIGTREKNQSKGAKITSNIYGKINVKAEKNKYPKELGRFPANILLDEEAARLLDEQSDLGNTSRFFYVAKASKSERGEGNTHPTIKPLKLIKYLIKLTSIPSPDQIYLDPFAGSGTTAIACEKFGKKWIGIELKEKHCEIAKNRIRSATRMKRLI